MKTIKTNLLLFAGGILLLASCAKKEELPNKTYYARVLVEVAALPGTPALEVRYQGKKIGDLPLMQPGTTVETGSNTKLAVFVKGTDQLVADTVVNLNKNQLSTYKVAYNKDLGISGWISSKPVQQDSMSIQFLNSLGDFYKAYPAYDLCIFYYDYNTGTLEDYNKTLINFQNIKLTASAVLLPYYFGDKANGLINVFVGRIKDRATGQFVNMPSSGQDFFVLPQVDGGANYIFNLYDTSGEVSSDSIAL
ncbi:hypothetical protein [Mucilaginibacter paludis]|uniref:DUF4397 domain-containing protein n=1 Tax=Mucilaginibacter paludis DSM 18603 TaxID=714943 RepID=H1Y937_9SPHI|nr:hypothetical protein [Mucilaginibacter paludis]EHQ29075.1 hypothetical protein Mucpa_4996 [Mucilaginibacter paludis DSM 18603]